MVAGERTVRLGTGITTRLTVTGRPGRRPPLVLLHAWAESRRSFCRLVPRLPAGLHAVIPDLRGHGEADQPLWGYRLADLAADVLALLDELAVDRAVLVGSSSGGYLAQQVAVDAPDRVAGLVLAGAPRTLRGPVPFSPEIDALRDPISPAWARAFVAGFTGPEVPGWFLELMTEDALSLPAEVWRVSLAGLTGSVPPTDAGTISAPTLVVSGTDDVLVDRPATAALVRAIPGAQWTEYPATGHAVLWERPEQLAADIAAFSSRLADDRLVRRRALSRQRSFRPAE